MNAAIRAVTRAAIYNGMAVKGIYRGYKGLITNEIEDFKTQSVSNIIQRGGTILKTARCAEFQTPEGRKLAYEGILSTETAQDAKMIAKRQIGRASCRERV